MTGDLTAGLQSLKLPVPSRVLPYSVVEAYLALFGWARVPNR